MSSDAIPETAAPTPAPTSPEPERTPCPNCGTPMLGEFCYACGQPRKGLVRHFSSIFGDFVDSVLNFDNRTWRTLGPLMFRPGALTIDFLNGRRVRYVSPLRLYFFLSVIAFLLIGVISGPSMQVGPQGIHVGPRIETGDLARATPEKRAADLAELERSLSFMPEGTRREVMDNVRRELDAEVAKLEKEKAREAAEAAKPKAPSKDEAAPDAPAPSPPSAPTPPKPKPKGDGKPNEANLSFNGKEWDPKTNPLTFDWLPDRANAALNDEIGVLKLKLNGIKENPQPFINQMFSTAPQALFVILPLFALLLKVFYLFKRRLYMEHLIVALHSHSFMCLALIVIAVCSMAQDWLGESHTLINGLLGWIEFLLWLWMPIYLLIMQKRVYRQGWIMTSLKYMMIGACYMMLLTLGMLLTLLVSLIVL